jgi:hypothetical protein
MRPGARARALAQGDRAVHAACLGQVAGNRAAEDGGEAQLGDEQGQAKADRSDRAHKRDRGVAQPQQHAVSGQAPARGAQPLSNLGQHFYNHRSLWRQVGAETERNPNIAEAIC